MSTTRATDRRPVWAIASAFGLTVAAFVFSSAVGAVVLTPMFLAGYTLEDTIVVVSSTVAGQLAFLGVGVGYVYWRSLPVPISRPSRSNLLTIVAGTIAALVVASTMIYAAEVLEVLPSSVLENAGASDPTFLLVMAVLSILVVAPAEEFLFRGVVQGRLRQTFGPVGAVAGSSLLFGSMHLPNYLGSAVEIATGGALIATVAVVFGYVYERTRNLTVPILVHGVYNAILFGSSYVVG